MPMTTDVPNSAVSGATAAKEIMLFGVRVVVDLMRKSVSMNNLSQYEHPPDTLKDDNAGKSRSIFSAAERKKDSAPGYASADDAIPNAGGNRERERKRGVPWTEEEHKLFLLGLQKVGKGDWRGISRNFVKSRTPTQVASHAQKYFLRRSNLNRRRRRSSLFDITTDSVKLAAEEGQIQLQDNSTQLQSYHQVMPTFSLSVCPAVLPMSIPIENQTLGHENLENGTSLKKVHSRLNATTTDLNLNSTSTLSPGALSLNLALPLDSANSSMVQGMSSMSSGDSVISVA